MKFESKKLVTKFVLVLFMMVICGTVAFAEQAPDDFSGHAYCATGETHEGISTAGYYFKEDGRFFIVNDKLYSIGEILKVLPKKNVSEKEISQLGASCEYYGRWTQNKAKKELTVIPPDGSQEVVMSYTISSDGKILRIDEKPFALNRYY